MYMPIELYEIMRGATCTKVAIFVINSGIVIYLAYVLYQSRQTGKGTVGAVGLPDMSRSVQEDS
jgi:uncharacterized membrane protein (DUF2068 family)